MSKMNYELNSDNSDDDSLMADDECLEDLFIFDDEGNPIEKM